MIIVLKYKEVKIKKPRKCWGCGFIISVNRTMKYVVCVNDGYFGTTYWCEICDSYLLKYPELSCEEGIAENEFKGESHYEDFKKENFSPERKVLTEKFRNNCKN